MEVEWDDSYPYQFLREYGTRSSRLFRLCASAELQFKNVPVESIVRKGDISDNHYKVHEESVRMYGRKIRRGEKIGTLFCRRLDDDRWFLKDGNHRFLACLAEGISEVRIAYSERNEL